MWYGMWHSMKNVNKLYLHSCKDHVIQWFCRVSNQAQNRVPILSASRISPNSVRGYNLTKYLNKRIFYLLWSVSAGSEVSKVRCIKYFSVAMNTSIDTLSNLLTWKPFLFFTSCHPLTASHWMGLRYCTQETTTIISLFSFHFLVCYPRLCWVSFTEVPLI